jgi:transcription termination/antitermination protein NusA
MPCGRGLFLRGINDAFTKSEQPSREWIPNRMPPMTETTFRFSSQPNAAQQDFGSRLEAATLGLEDAIDDIPGLLASMLVAFGKNGIKTVEDLAACATDDLLGWTERRGDEITMHPGILGDMVVSRKECDAIILQARIRVGWIEAAALTA